jgi:SCY1-like protein 1
VHARVAGLMAFMASVDVFDVEELAGKVVPNIAGSMVDKEKYVLLSSFGYDGSPNLFLFTVRLVRDQAFKAVELFVRKLESHAATMVCIFFHHILLNIS